jgi:hypothetical protein
MYYFEDRGCPVAEALRREMKIGDLIDPCIIVYLTETGDYLEYFLHLEQI